MIVFTPTRNIDLVEYVANHPDIQPGSSNGHHFSYNPSELYFEIRVHNEFAGLARAREVQSRSYECHAMILKHMRGFSKDLGLAFWKYLFTTTNAACVLSMASDKYRIGKLYCASIGLKRRGVIPKFFDGIYDVTLYSATREELGYG
ncbi:MAG: DUF2824 family protein [Citrobacter amalonaticus]|nr:DUF2824 family protein [Citrobacter amalonaticus]